MINKMKTGRILLYSASVLATVSMLSACSNIDADERLIEIEPATVAKRVLIEDFTGQRCPNCPGAMEKIEELQEQYGADNIIAVGIYGGSFGQTVSGKPYPLTTETGNHYYDKWSISAQPTGMIDRQGKNVDVSSWGTAVRTAIQKTTPLTLDVSTSYDATSSTVGITVDAETTNDIEGTLQVWLVEDNVVSTQINEDGKSFNKNFVHNHVFRSAVNAVDGEAFTLGYGKTDSRSYTATIDSSWKAEDMYVVAFVAGGDGIYQVAKTKVTDGNANVTE